MKLNYFAKQAYARTIAASASLSLIESSKVETPCTDGSRIWVPLYDPNWPDDSHEEIEWWGKLIHETYHNDKQRGNHISFKLVKDRANKLKKEKKVIAKRWKHVHNIFEDFRIERNAYGEYPGQDKCMDRLRKQMLAELKKDVTSIKNGADNACVVLQYAAFSTFQRGCIGEDVDSWALSPELQSAYATCKHLMSKLLDARQPKDIMDLTDEYCALFADEEDESGGQSQPQPSEGAGDGEGGDEEEGAAKYAIVDHSKPPPTTGLPKENNVEWKYRRSTVYGSYPGGIPFEIQKSKDLSTPHSDSFVTRVLENVRLQGLASQIKRLLMVQSATRMQGGHKRGVLDSGTLWKGVVYNGTDAGRRVFKQKEDTLSLDTVVSLVVDQSGSMMSCGKIHCATAAAVAMNEVFGKIGIKCRVVGFSDTSNETVHYIHQDFGERIKPDELARRVSKSINYKMSANADGENIMYEYSQISARQEPKKVMIVLSDGMPADSKSLYDVTTHTETVCRAIERSGKVSLFGIGIMSHSVEMFYKKHRVINDPYKIEEAVLQVLKDEVISNATKR